MSFNIIIKADPGATIPTIDQVGAALAKTEAKADQLGAATKRALDGTSASAERAKNEVVTIGDAFSAATSKSRGGLAGLNDLLGRQNDILERIRGPVHEYEADMRVLNELYEKNAVTAAEYAGEVNKLEAALARHQKASSQAMAPVQQVGPGGAAGGGGVGPTAFAVGATLAIGAELVSLTDHYTTLSNSAQRFADATHGVDTVLHDQLQLSRDLHGSLDDTLKVYGRVREGLQDLNLTYDETNRLTKTLGEGAILSGKSLDDAAGIAQRLSYAMESGVVTTRDLNTTMRGFPELAEVMMQATGKTEKELLALAKSGELSAHTLTAAFLAGGAELDAKMGRQVETVGQKFQHFKDDVTVAAGALGEFAGVKLDWVPMYDGVEAVQKLVKSLQEAHDGIQKVQTAMLGDKFEFLVKGAEHGAVQGTKKHHEELSDEQKLLEEILKPQKDYTNGVRELEDLLGHHLITLDQYHQKFSDIAAAYDKATNASERYMGAADSANAIGRRFIERQGGIFDPQLEPAGPSVGAATGPTKDPQAERAVQLYTALEGPIGKYKAELAEVNTLHEAGKLWGGAYDDVLKDLHDRYAVVVTPLEELTKKSALLHKELDAGLVSTKDYDDALSKLRMSLGQGTVDDGLADGWKKIQAQVNDTAKTISETLVGAFGKANDALASFVTTGKGDFSGLFQSLEQDLVKLSLQGLEKSLIDKISPAATGLASNAAATALTGSASALGVSAGGLGTAATGLDGAALSLQVAADRLSAGGGGGLAGLFGGSGGGGDIPSAGPGGSWFNPYAPDFGGGDGVDAVSSARRAYGGPAGAYAGQAGATGGPSTSARAAPVVHVHIHDDPRALMAPIASGDADQHIINVFRRNPGVLRTLAKP